mgnify:CR=1 FL=1
MNSKIKKYIISENKKILDIYKNFDRNNENICLVVDKNNKFLGVVTPTDIRKGITKGVTLQSKISEITNRNPIILRGKINDNKISDIVSKKNYNFINPPLIPFIDDNNVPYDLVEKENINTYKNKKLTKKKSGQKILLIGGAGYIGSVLTKKLLLSGNSVDVFDKFIYLKKKNFEKIINHKKLNCIKGDSRHMDKVFESIKKCDAVVHLAEMVGDPLCEKRPTKTYVTNYLASITIASVCKNLGINKFIYISSCSVYGSNKDERLLDENSNINPLSVYAKLKAICEKTIITNLGNNFRPCILRLGTVFGNSLRPRYDLVVNLFAGQVANNKTINIEGGQQWRPFIHVEDVCNAIILILKLPHNKTNGQIFNLVGENIRIIDLGKKIQKIYPKAKVLISKTRKDFRDYKVSSQKAKKYLKFKPRFSITYGLRTMVHSTKKNKIKKINSTKFINILNSNKF